VDPYGLTCKENNIVTYRGDRRSIEVIFQEGFKPKGDSTDLQNYTATNEASIYVSTSKDPEIAIDFATNYGTSDGVIYAVRSSNGIDVNKKLGNKSPFPEEQEIAIPGGATPAQVLGATPVKADGSYSEYSILNPKAYQNGN
jgi:hypothetical protein